MTDQERVMTLWAGANPIRNADVAELARDDSATYLATLTQRSSEMTRLETTREKPAEPKPRRQRWVAVAAAAAAVVVIGAAYQFLAGDGTASSPPVVAEVRFDGQECVYEGPGTITAGDVEFTFRNVYTGGSGRLDIITLEEGKGAGDLDEYMSASGLFGLPPWSAEIHAWRVVPAGESQTSTVAFEPGLAHMVCSMGTPFQGFIGGELIVTD